MDTKEYINKLPEEIRNVVLSSNLYTKVQAIAEKHNLLIDQIGELASETRMVLIGMTRSKDFVSRVSENLDISKEVAVEIAKDINLEIFDSIRAAIQKVQENTQIDLQKNEAIAKPTTGLVSSIAQFTSIQTPQSRDAILNSIENPIPHNTAPINVLEKLDIKKEFDISEHMLSGTVTAPIITETLRTAAPLTPSPEVKKATYSTDPYRETIK